MKTTLKHKTPDISKLPGGFIPTFCPVIEGGHEPFVESIMDSSHGQAFVIHGVLSAGDCERMIKFMDDAPVAAPVSVTGFMDGQEHAAYGGVAGSTRTTMWTEELSSKIWELMRPFFGPRYMLDKTATDWWQAGVTLGEHLMKPNGHLLAADTEVARKMYHRHWLPIGCSPMMRFMRYDSGGEHYAHYDAGYIYEGGDNRTLMSIVIYLTTNENGGETRFINDSQHELPIWEQKHDDWTRRVENKEVIRAVKPKAGSILVFDHRLCHDVSPYMDGNPRVIVRGDIIYGKYNKI